MWLPKPSKPAKTGKMNSPRKAKTFPARPTVTSGLATTRPAMANVIASTAATAAVGMQPLLSANPYLSDWIYLIKSLIWSSVNFLS